MSGGENSELVRLIPAEQLAKELQSARDLLDMDKVQDAISALEQVLSRVPGSAEAYCLRGIAQQRLGNMVAATSDLDRACALAPGLPKPWLLRAESRLQSGQTSEAITDIRTALECAPSPPELTQAGRLLVDAGEEGFALDVLSSVIEQTHREVPALHLRGKLQMSRGCFVAALADYATCCILEPDVAQHWVNRGNAFYELGEYELAIRDYQAALEIEPALTEVSLNLGCIALDEDEVEVAIRYFDRAIELDPDSPRAHLNRGLAYYYRQMDQKAELDFQQAMDLEPEDADAYFGMARLLARQARYSQAAKALGEALARSPEYVDELLGDDVFRDLRKLSSVKRMIATANEILD